MGPDVHTDNRELMQTHEDSPLDHELLTANDILLVPQVGKLRSRGEAKLKPFIYSSPMDTVTGHELTNKMTELGEFAVTCRFLPEEWKTSLEALQGNENIFFSVGSKREQSQELVDKIKSTGEAETWENECMSISLDVAHGDTEYMHTVYSWWSRQPFVKSVMSGAICTPNAAIRAAAAGCTHLRVGVGPGAACTTRLKTGCGFPQLSAIYYIDKALKINGIRDKVQIIADGGIKHPGDAIKYLAAGADGVMLGSLLSTTWESHGWTDGEKQFRGQASKSFQQDHYGSSYPCSEGATGPTMKRDESLTVESVIGEFRGGMRSALSYLGLTSMEELKPENVTFARVTSSAWAEGLPHGT